jgi:hypothetical protein
VKVPLPESLILWHAIHELLDAIPVFEAWETQSGVFFLQHVAIVHPHTLLLDPTLDRFLLFTCRKRVVGTVLYVRPKATLSVVFPWLSNVIAQRTAGTGVCFSPRQRGWRWVRLRVCDAYNMFEVGKRVQVFD